MKIKKRYTIFFSALILLFLAFTEASAIRYSFPNQRGENVFEKEFDKKKVVVWDTGTESYVKLISRNWAVFHRSTTADEISVITPDEKMKFTWSATLKDGKYYDTLFAAQILDPNIVKVIVSNESSNENDLSLSEVKEQSTVYVKMNVINGYAAHYSYLHTSDVGGFVFRGLNSEGEVISVQ